MVFDKLSNFINKNISKDENIVDNFKYSKEYYIDLIECEISNNFDKISFSQFINDNYNNSNFDSEFKAKLREYRNFGDLNSIFENTFGFSIKDYNFKNFLIKNHLFVNQGKEVYFNIIKEINNAEILQINDFNKRLDYWTNNVKNEDLNNYYENKSKNYYLDLIDINIKLKDTKDYLKNYVNKYYGSKTFHIEFMWEYYNKEGFTNEIDFNKSNALIKLNSICGKSSNSNQFFKFILKYKLSTNDANEIINTIKAGIENKKINESNIESELEALIKKYDFESISKEFLNINDFNNVEKRAIDAVGKFDFNKTDSELLLRFIEVRKDFIREDPLNFMISFNRMLFRNLKKNGLINKNLTFDDINNQIDNSHNSSKLNEENKSNKKDNDGNIKIKESLFLDSSELLNLDFRAMDSINNSGLTGKDYDELVRFIEVRNDLMYDEPEMFIVSFNRMLFRKLRKNRLIDKDLTFSDINNGEITKIDLDNVSKSDFKKSENKKINNTSPNKVSKTKNKNPYLDVNDLTNVKQRALKFIGDNDFDDLTKKQLQKFVNIRKDTIENDPKYFIKSFNKVVNKKILEKNSLRNKSNNTNTFSSNNKNITVSTNKNKSINKSNNNLIKDINSRNSSVDSLLNELNELVGLNIVKNDVNSLINLISINQIRAERGLKQPNLSLHLVFSGNPGTGKTTVARILSKIYHNLGLLSKGHLVETDRSGLVAGYVGQTAIKVQEVIKEAMGGILFIDEAYTLVSKGEEDYGQEAIDTLLKAMEDHRDDFIVIVAGYPDLMEKFLHSNPGLQSRFNKFIDFEDYTPGELYDIFISMCNKSNLIIEDAVGENLRKYFKEIYENRDDDFANAREVRNIFENVLTNQANRIVSLPNIDDNDLKTITVDDFTIF